MLKNQSCSIKFHFLRKKRYVNPTNQSFGKSKIRLVGTTRLVYTKGMN